MDLLTLKEFVANLAVITTILQFLSGVLVCKKYVVNRTTAEASPLPFVCGFLSTGLWLLYGLIKRDDKIVIVNTVGIVLMFSYIIVFYMFTFKKSSVLRQFLITIGIYTLIITYTATEEDVEILINRLGFLSCSLTLMTIAAPMSKLVYVIKTKCTECLPFPLIFMSFIVSSLWFLYGVLEEDVFLTTSNFIGGALGVAQLSLFLIFPNTPHSPLLSKSTSV